MAKLSAVLDHGLSGGKIRRAGWKANVWITFTDASWVTQSGCRYTLSQPNWCADDWEICAEPATYEEIAAYFERMVDEVFDERVLASSAYRACAYIVRTRKIPEGV